MSAAESTNAPSVGPRRLRDAAYEEVTLPDGVVEIRRVGSGTPLVFVHGVFVNGDIWRNVVDGLSDRFECIVIEMPLGGHRVPMSPQADLSPGGLANLLGRVIEKLGVGPANLVANDSGGAIAQIFTANNPDSVKSLVLTSCDAYEYFFPPLFRGLPLAAKSKTAMALLGRLMQYRWARHTPLAYGWATKRAMPIEVEKSYVRPLLNPLVRRDLAKALRGVSSEHTIEAARKLRDYHGKVLLVWGEYDKFFPVHTAYRLARELPDTQLELLPDVGAFVPEDAPERVVELIGAFYGASAKS